MRRRRSGQRALMVAPLLALALSRQAAAVPNDHLAVQLLPNESAWDGALAFDRACYRAGVSGVRTRPVQPFQHASTPFVRLAVEGPANVGDCLIALEKGRRGVSGGAHWFDGFAGGFVTNQLPGEPEDRVPDAEWLDPNGKKLEPPAVDPELVEPLARGSAEAIQRLNALPLGAALATTEVLAGRNTPGSLAVLELIAKQHPHWRVRRAAVEALNPLISVSVLSEVLRRDPAWEVRAGAVEMLQTMGNAVDPEHPARSTEVAKLITDTIAKDAAWEVRRQAIWMLSNELVSDAKSVLRERAQTDSEPQVRAAALEALAGARQLDHGEAKRALQDKAPEVRAVAAAALASELKASDTPDLWKALNDPERGVRLAASTFLPHIQDASIGSKLWMLYLAESEQLDADPQFQRAVLDELGRAPFPELAHQVQERLQQPLSPIERRLLSRLFSKLNPVAAAQRFLAEMQAGEPQTRALAADVAPATPEVRARRFELLQDPDSDVRAAAIIGLCRAPDAPRDDERLGRVPLDPTPLGQEAVITRSQCGTPEPTPQPMQTSLEGSANMASGGANTGIWPALAGMVLMLASVFALRLKAKA